MSGLSFERETITSPNFVVPTFVFLGLLQTMNRYLRISMGVQRPHTDVRCCWRPFAEGVLAGNPIYVRPVVDNKPPLFELLNVAVAATGRYLFVFLLLVGLANAAIGILVWRVGAQRSHSRAGLLAGVLFLASVPITGGMVVNVRSFAIAGILLSLTLSHPVARGVAVAAAGLFSQHAVFAIPAVAYDRIREFDRRRQLRWLGLYALSGVGLVAASFAFVYAVWGWESLQGGLFWTFLVAGRYATNPTVPSLIGDTQGWFLQHYFFSLRHLTVLIPAVIVGYVAATEADPKRFVRSTNGLVLTAGLLALSMSVPLFVRAYRAYWLYPMPFLALLAALGIEELFTVGEP